MKRVGVIRVLTVQDERLLNLHGRLIEGYFPTIETVSRCIPDHPNGVHDLDTKNSAIPLVVNLAREFEKEGFDAIVVSCAGDPGVAESRLEVGMPVVGAGQSTAAIALGFGGKIVSIGIGENVPANMASLLGSSLICHIRPIGVSTTLDLMTAEGKRAAREAGLEAKRKGAEVIVLACTGLSTIGADKVIKEATGLQVIDPVVAEGVLAHFAVIG